MSVELDAVLALIKANNDGAVRRHEDLREAVRLLVTKVESLSESRTLAVGAWKATAAIAGGVAGVVSALGFILGWLFRISQPH